jgi:Ca-activated chloride channel family protein
LKYILRILAVFFLILGLSNPKIGTNLKEVKRDGIEIIIALDLSNSMLCEDIKPNRLLRSKQAISELIDNLEGDRIGLVVFAGEAYTQLPITSDYSAAKMFLSTINTNTIKTQGTNLSAAISQSVKSFNFENEFNKSIIIITDGEDHEKGALHEVRLAAEKGIFIHTLSIGDENGGPIPRTRGKGFKKDRKGNIIVTKPNFVFLSELANIGNGININANNSEIGLKQLFKEISKIEKKEISDMKFTNYSNRFQWFLFVSLFLFLLELSILNIKNNIIEKWIKK